MSPSYPVQIINPLTNKQCDDVDCILRDMPSIRATIAAAERCGLDCTADKQRLDAQETFALAVKREFNPLAP